MRHKALLAWRAPPGLRRCRVVLPDDAGIGATAHRCAQAASERRRSGWSPAAMRSMAAVSRPTPNTARRVGARAVTRGAMSSASRSLRWSRPSLFWLRDGTHLLAERTCEPRPLVQVGQIRTVTPVGCRDTPGTRSTGTVRQDDSRRRQPIRRSDRDPGLPTLRPQRSTSRDGIRSTAHILPVEGGPPWNENMSVSTCTVVAA